MATEPGVGRPRRWPRRLIIGVNVFLALCLVLTGAVYAWIKWQLGRVDRIDLACDVLRNCGDDDPEQPMNVLLVGSDSRASIEGEADTAAFGDAATVGGQRSDVIIVLHVDPDAERASLLSIPRDLSVPIAGTTTPRRINEAFSKGPDVLITTIREQLGIPIDHYAQVDFNGFRGIVDAIGGVTLYFQSPARDPKTGLDIRAAGCVKMNGQKALAYVRSRDYHYLEGGKWRTDPTGDLGRIERQQSFIRRVLGKASQVGRNPLRLNSIVSSAVTNVTLDKAFSTKDMKRLAIRFKSLEPDAVEMLALPTVGARERGASVLKLKQPEAGEIVDRLLGKVDPAPDPSSPPPKVLPGTVRVRVLNGTGADGQASAASQALQRAHFGVAGTGDADRRGYPRTVIRYARGQQPKASLLQAYVDGPTQLSEDTALRGGDLVLVTGAGFQGIRAAPGAAPATTSTTAGSTTTTTPAKPAKAPAPAAPAC